MSELIANRYELGSVVGSGGMSVVYSATDTLLGREVAVKMLRSELARDANFRERFRREAQNAGRLNHPAIVAIYDTGETLHDGQSTPYIVMELVKGRNLKDIVAKRASARRRTCKLSAACRRWCAKATSFARKSPCVTPPRRR